jgi:hypothetical protein
LPNKLKASRRATGKQQRRARHARRRTTGKQQRRGATLGAG